jgi:phage terminase small subunit
VLLIEVVISCADEVGWWVSGKGIGEIRRMIEKCASLSQQWAQNNAVVFDIDKTEIVLLSRRRKMNRASKEGIQVAPGIMTSLNSHATRWLGVWIDSHLSLKEHHNTMMSKAYRAEARIRSLRGKFGLSPENVRKIQVAAVQAVAFYHSDHGR